jgi:hypothetical protein
VGGDSSHGGPSGEASVSSARVGITRGRSTARAADPQEVDVPPGHKVGAGGHAFSVTPGRRNVHEVDQYGEQCVAILVSPRRVQENMWRAARYGLDIIVIVNVDAGSRGRAGGPIVERPAAT